MQGITGDNIIQRIKAGQTAMARFVRKDKAACRRYLDATDGLFSTRGEEGESLEEIPSDQAEGQYNPMMVNILTKVAATGLHDPDWHFTARQDPTGSFPLNPTDLLRKLYREIWRRFGWTREFQTVLTKRYSAGMGFAVLLWEDPHGPVFEHVQSWDLSVDPHVEDWRKLRWAARQIHLPREEAVERYGAEHFSEGPEIHDIDSERDEEEDYPADSVALWVYWDRDSEIVIYLEQVIYSGPNQYGRVPLFPFQGDINPGQTRFGLGDFDVGVGLQAMYSALLEMLLNTARHGSGQGWYRPEAFETADQEALRKSRQQGFVAINGMRGEDAIGYTRNEPMNPAVLEGINEMQRAIDATQGVSQFQRGVLDEGLKFATEGVLLANQGGARGQQARTEFDLYVEEIGWALLDYLIRFGQPESQEEWLLQEALLLIEEVQCHPGSTTYKDPSVEQQALLQLWQMLAPAAQMIGLDLRKFALRLMKSFGIYDAQQDFIPESEWAMMQQQIMMAAQSPAPPDEGAGE